MPQELMLAAASTGWRSARIGMRSPCGGSAPLPRTCATWPDGWWKKAYEALCNGPRTPEIIAVRYTETRGNSSAAFTQYLTEDTGLQLQNTVSAFPSSSHSDSREGVFSGLYYSSLALRPVALLALLSEQTRFAPGLRGRLLPGFRRLGHPRRRRISLQCQLGNLHWRDSRPLDHQLASLHVLDHAASLVIW